MNAANHGQCHIRRNSRDERVESLATVKEKDSKQEKQQENQQQADVTAPEPSTKNTVGSEQCHGHQLRHGHAQEVTENTPLLDKQGQGNGNNGSSTVLRRTSPHHQRHHQPRGRSGSWSGVNESEDELEGMAQALHNQSVPQVKVVGPEGGVSRYGSVSSGLTNDLNHHHHHHHHHLDDSTTTNTTALLHPDVTPDRMQRKLKFFFMNTIEKWHARRRFPWKLLLQVFKIVVVTAQLCLFAQQRYNHVNYLWDTKVSFSHLFIKGWDSTMEIQAYPPGTGPLAVYEKGQFYAYLDFAIIAYSQINDKAIGTFSYKYNDGELVLPTLCNSHYSGGHVFLNNNTYVLSDNITTSCIDIPLLEANATEWTIEKYLKEKNFTINFDLLLNTEFTFHLRTIKLRVNLPFETPDCYGLTGKLVFNNHDHDGQMLVELDMGAQVLECHGSVMLVSQAHTLKVWRRIINITSIIICIVSLIMCVRAMYRAQLLRRVTEEFFRRHFGKELTFEERMEFVNLWYLLICINDILIIFGSLLKIGLESKSYEGYLDTWNVCSLFLGTGNLLVWFGCLRYLGFFTTYNVLILTVKKCIPNVLRFSICIMMVFAGYSLCGWLVLGPYHLKFRSFSSTMECLYSLINGDDMFATFSSTSGKDPLVWWFSRIYLYSFISLFIYVILSLFIAIIMDAYETIKHQSDTGMPLNNLMKFVQECTEEPSSSVFHDEGDHTIHDVINSICCCGYQSNQQSAEYEPLLS